MKKRALVLAALLTGASSMAGAVESFYVTAGGDVGMGTNVPAAALHVVRDDASGNTTELLLENSSGVKLGLLNTDSGVEWVISNDSRFRIMNGNVGMNITNAGDMEVTGTVTANNVQLTSDRNAKTAFRNIDGNQVLEKLRHVPVTSWSYKNRPDERHVGPMAQDFYAAFGLGNSDKRISMIDAAGIALAAVKALTERLEEKEARIAELEKRLARQEELAARIQALEAVTVRLIQQQQQPALRTAAMKQP